MMAPPYPGMMYQTSQGMVYAAAPTSALPNGVIFSLSQGQLQLQHAAADSGTSVFAVRLSQVCTLSFKHLFLCVCIVSSLDCCFHLARSSQFRHIRPERDPALFVVCQFSGMCYLNDATFLFFFPPIPEKLYKHRVDLKPRTFFCMPHKMSFQALRCFFGRLLQAHWLFSCLRTRAVDEWTRSRCLMITMILLLDMFVCVCVCVLAVLLTFQRSFLFPSSVWESNLIILRSIKIEEIHFRGGMQNCLT